MPVLIKCLQRLGPVCIVEVRPDSWAQPHLDLDFQARVATAEHLYVYPGAPPARWAGAVSESLEMSGEGCKGVSPFDLLLLMFFDDNKRRRTVPGIVAREEHRIIRRKGSPPEHVRELVRGITLYARACDMPADDTCSTWRLNHVVCIRTGSSLHNTSRWGPAASHASRCFELLSTCTAPQQAPPPTDFHGLQAATVLPVLVPQPDERAPTQMLRRRRKQPPARCSPSGVLQRLFVSQARLRTQRVQRCSA